VFGFGHGADGELGVTIVGRRWSLVVRRACLPKTNDERLATIDKRLLWPLADVREQYQSTEEHDLPVVIVVTHPIFWPKSRR
jgi:hypothetical protein